MGLLILILAAGVFVGCGVTYLLLRKRRPPNPKPFTPPTHARLQDSDEGHAPTTTDNSTVIDLDAQREAAAARLRDQRAASRAQREAQRIAAEAEAQREAQRIAAEAEAQREAQRITAEAEAQREAQRIAAEAEAQREAQRIAAEAAAQREAQRIAAEAEAQREAQRIAAEAEALREAQRIAAEAEAQREAQRIAAEAEAQREAQRIAAEAAAQREAQRIAAEAEAQREAQRIAAETEAQRVAAEQIQQRTTAKPPKTPKTPEETIVMIVDDSKVGRVKTNRFLLNQHFQSQMAEDGLDAVQKIAAQMPDIVITDVEMPGMDGFELTREIRRNPATAHLPVIIISGNDEGYAARAQEVGADLILGKPYSETDMAAHLHRFMQNGR